MTTATKKHDLIYGEDKRVSDWVAERILGIGRHGLSKGPAIGVMSDGRLIAGVVYNEYQPEHRTMQLHIASSSPMWARKETIRDLLAYPFLQLGVYKCWVQTPIDNEKSLKATKHIGFQVEAVLRHHFGIGRNGVISGMVLPEYKQLYINGDISNG